MKATGMLFLSRGRPQLTRTADGTHQLLLRAVHRIGQRQTEPWTLIWTGEDAHAFYTAHANTLQPGQPLQVTAKNLRTHSYGHLLVEIQAQVERCELLPPSEQTKTTPQEHP